MDYCQACRAAHRNDPPCKGCENALETLNTHDETIWELWQHCNTQMRWGQAGPLGLDYQGCRVAADAIGIDWTPGVFLALRSIELAYIEELMPEPQKETR